VARGFDWEIAGQSAEVAEMGELPLKFPRRFSFEDASAYRSRF